MSELSVPVENLTLGQLAHLVEQARTAGASDDAPVTVDAPGDDSRLADPYQLEIHPSWARTGPPSTAKLRRVSSLWSPVTTHHI